MDVHDKKTRSYNMSQIRGENTTPEKKVRKFLFSQGFRFRKNVSALPGKPDIVLPKYRTCIFVNGCFWHMHDGCKCFVWPKSNAKFWRDKILSNKERDKKVIESLKQAGWRVITIWECELKGKECQTTLEGIVQEIKTNYQ